MFHKRDKNTPAPQGKKYMLKPEPVVPLEHTMQSGEVSEDEPENDGIIGEDEFGPIRIPPTPAHKELKNIPTPQRSRNLKFVDVIKKTLPIIIGVGIVSFFVISIYNALVGFGVIGEDSAPLETIGTQSSQSSPGSPSKENPGNSESVKTLRMAIESVDTINTRLVEIIQEESIVAQKYTENKINRVGLENEVKLFFEEKNKLIEILASSRKILIEYGAEDFYNASLQRIKGSFLMRDVVHQLVEGSATKADIKNTIATIQQNDRDIALKQKTALIYFFTTSNIVYTVDTTTGRISYTTND